MLEIIGGLLAIIIGILLEITIDSTIFIILYKAITDDKRSFSTILNDLIKWFEREENKY